MDIDNKMSTPVDTQEMITVNLGMDGYKTSEPQSDKSDDSDDNNTLLPSDTDNRVKKERKPRSRKINKLTKAQVRINHVTSEKKRREIIRSIYDELVDLVPDLENAENRSELIIYLKSINYLRWLYKKNERLRTEIAMVNKTKNKADDANISVSDQLVWELKK